MQITLYKNKSDNKIVSKNLQDAMSINGVLKENCSIVSPTFIIDKSDRGFLNGYNYLYSDELKRYYYINGITYRTGSVMELQCTVDVLMTYSNQIRELITVVERQESIYNPYLEDSAICISQGSIIKAIDVGQVGDETYNCYMTVIGSSGEEDVSNE